MVIIDRDTVANVQPYKRAMTEHPNEEPHTLTADNSKYIYDTFRDLNSFAETKLGIAATIGAASVLFVAKEATNDPNAFELYEVSIISLGFAILLQIFSMLPFTERVFIKPKKPFSGNPFFFEDVARSTLDTFQKAVRKSQKEDHPDTIDEICAQAHVLASIASRKFRLFRISMVFLALGISTAVLALGGY